jgi:PKD repeat protein
MRSSHVLSFASAAALLAACGGDSNGPSNSPPTADFTPPSCTVNVACSFAGTGTDSDGSITAYSWDFGDATSAVSGQNITHTFTTANTFQVKLTTTDNGGATGSVTKPVTVAATGQGPTASFTVTCNGLDCSFTDTSTPAGSLTYAWDFGEPSSGANNTSTSQNPTHTYTATAVTNFTVTLTVTDAQGTPSSPASQTITVTPPANLQCQTGGSLVDCTLDITSKAKITITLTSSDCEFTGNRFAITQPIQQTVFTNGCNKALIGTVYTINGPNSDGSFDAGTSLQAQFTQGVGAPTDPTRGPPAIKLTGTFPTWTISIDDGGNPTGPGEPDFNDIVLSVQATAVP